MVNLFKKIFVDFRKKSPILFWIIAIILLIIIIPILIFEFANIILLIIALLLIFLFLLIILLINYVKNFKRFSQYYIF
jgi:hypothetical protein